MAVFYCSRQRSNLIVYFDSLLDKYSQVFLNFHLYSQRNCNFVACICVNPAYLSYFSHLGYFITPEAYQGRKRNVFYRFMILSVINYFIRKMSFILLLIRNIFPKGFPSRARDNHMEKYSLLKIVSVT